MAIAHSVSLGEFTPKKKAKYLKIPKFKLDFDFNTDTGHDVTDEEVKKQVDKLGPKILATHFKSRLKDIEKALEGVDKDIEKKKAAFMKANGISAKAKTITPQQKTAMDKFVAQTAKLVENLQKYLQQIVDGINKSDSLKWIDEIYEKAYSKLKKLISRYEFNRGSGGRAKIIILAAVTVVVTAVAIAATVVTGGAAIVVIAGVAAGVLSIVATSAKAGLAIAKTRGKLRRSIEKLGAQAEEVQRLTKMCDDVAKKSKGYDSNFKKQTGMSEKDYKAVFGTGKPDPERLFPILKGHKKVFQNFQKYLKDVEMLSVKINLGIREIDKSLNAVKAQSAAILKKTQEAEDKVALFSGKKGAALKKFVKEAPARLKRLEGNMKTAKEDLQRVSKLVNDNREIDKAFQKHGVVIKKIPGARVSIAKAETTFETMGDVAEDLGTLADALGDLT